MFSIHPLYCDTFIYLRSQQKSRLLVHNVRQFSANCSRHTVLEVEKQFHPIHVIITKTTGITIAILLIHKEIIIHHASSFIIIKNREKKKLKRNTRTKIAVIVLKQTREKAEERHVAPMLVHRVKRYCDQLIR